MFDLNKTPTLVEGEVNPQDSGTEKKLHIPANSATSAAPITLASSSTNYTFDSSDLAALLIMVQNLPNDHPSTPNLTFNCNHDRFPPHTSAFSEAPATAWRGSSSALPKQLAMVTIAPGDGAPAVRDVLVRQGRVVEVWSRNGAGGGLRGNPNQASQCQTTMDLDCDVVSDGESDSCKPRNSRDNSNSKAVLVDLDTLPNESPVELQFSWNPVHRGEPPLHTTTFRMSSENLQVSATKLSPKELEEEHRLREVAFHAAFKLETQRCTPTARCRSCLAFCQMRLPKLRLPSLQEGSGPGGGLQLREECPTVLRNFVDAEPGQARKLPRHGPKSKSSEYRGVTFVKRTGRWEAQIWHEGAQVYLGSYGTKEEASRAYDQAALLLRGPDVDINFKPESYQMEMAYLYKLSKEQLVIYLRRDSRGFGAQVSYPGVKLVKKYYKAMYGHVFTKGGEAMYGSHILGTFAIEEDAARWRELEKYLEYLAEPAFIVSLHGMNRRAVYKEAVRNSFGALASLILDTHHVRNMPSYAAQRFAALYPGVVEDTQLRNQAKAITSKRPSVPQRTSSPQNKKRWTRQAREPNQDSTSSPAAASAVAAPPHAGVVGHLPGNKLGCSSFEGSNFNDSSSNLDDSLKTGADSVREISTPINGNTEVSRVALVRAPAPTAASSSCHAPRAMHHVPSIPRATGEASSSGFIKFKLFNVEISVAVEPEHGGDRTEARGESERPPRKRCKIMH